MKRRSVIYLSGVSVITSLAGCTGEQELGGSSSSASGFDVSIESFTSEVEQGENITVYFTAENTGDSSVTRTIEFRVNGTTVESRSDIQLTAGESVSDSFSYTTGPDDPPSVEIAIATGEQTTTRTLPVEPAPPVESLETSITDVRSPSVGVTSATIPVLLSVENTHDSAEVPSPTLDYTGYINETEVVSDSVILVSIDPGESVTEEIDFLAEYLNLGESVVSAIENESFTVRITGSIESEDASTEFDDEYEF